MKLHAAAPARCTSRRPPVAAAAAATPSPSLLLRRPRPAARSVVVAVAAAFSSSSSSSSYRPAAAAAVTSPPPWQPLPRRAVGRRRLVVAAAVKAKSARAVCLSKTLVARPEALERVKELCQGVTDFSRARMAAEPRTCGIQEFACVVDTFEPATLHFWERYDSNAAMGKHNTSPELEAFMRSVAPLLERPVGMALYEYRDGKLGAVGIQGGPKGEGGLDDATGAGGAGGASYKQTSRLAQLQVLDDEDEESSSSSSGSRAPGLGSSSGSGDGAWFMQPAVLGAAAAGVVLLAVAARMLLAQ